MITQLDCAVLSEDVYNTHDRLAQSSGWTRLSTQSWGEGFAAEAYDKNGQKVVSFRGTDDMADVVSDARMAPSRPASDIARVMPALLGTYGLSNNAEAALIGGLVTDVLVDLKTRILVSQFGNQVPPNQTAQATQFLQALGYTPHVVTGHSLGGALAKVMALRWNIPCVAFNSPFMGNLRGVPPMSSGRLLSINTIGDPLSTATHAAGNLSHGLDMAVNIPPFPRQPPTRPAVSSYRRPTVCPTTSRANMMTPEGVYHTMMGELCNTAVDAWMPVGRAMSAPERNLNYLRERYPAYLRELLGFLSEIAGYFHSIVNLRTKMQNSGSQYNVAA